MTSSNDSNDSDVLRGDEIPEPFRSVLRDYLHVEWYELDDLRVEITQEKWVDRLGLFREQLHDAAFGQPPSIKAIFELTGQEFKDEAELIEWLRSLWTSLYETPNAASSRSPAVGGQIQFLCTIEDVFDLPGPGRVIVPGIPRSLVAPPGIGARILVRTPNGREFETTIASVAMINRGRPMDHVPFSVPRSIRKEDLPIGSSILYLAPEPDRS
jgi:hypothetical protein